MIRIVPGFRAFGLYSLGFYPLGFCLLGLCLLVTPPAMAQKLPEPPNPPAHIPDPELAPTPNLDSRLSLNEEQHATVELRMFHPANSDSGYAFTPGSRFRTPEERKPIQTPGVSVIVPIQ